MQAIYPILLAGGSGKRLWPLSRKSYPKQFSKLLEEKSLFQQSALRLKSSKKLRFNAPITITNSDFRFIVAEQLQEVAIDPGEIILEPIGKNTSAPILAASLRVYSKNPNAVLLVAPSDHLIPDISQFHRIISDAVEQVHRGRMVIFGIKPTDPVTSYGYLEISKSEIKEFGASNILKFTEKPSLELAEQMLATGNYLWNAGIFLFKAKDMIEAFKNHSPATIEYVSRAIDNASEDLGFLRLNPKSWAELEDISIDYAIMEKVRNLIAIPFSSKWSDLGDWAAVWSASEKDQSANAISDRAHAIKCSGSLIRSESPNQQVIGIGLKNIIAIAMHDAVLVAHRDMSQDVKNAVAVLKSQEIPQAENLPKDHRPWGWFESLSVGERFQVKRICVKPGGSLSLQSHNYRSEHWVVVKGTARVTIDREIKLVTEGQSVYVPIGATHRMENPGKENMLLIEVQIGSYLGEDDITRYEDIYLRD